MLLVVCVELFGCLFPCCVGFWFVCLFDSVFVCLFVCCCVSFFVCLVVCFFVSVGVSCVGFFSEFDRPPSAFVFYLRQETDKATY